MRIGAAVIPYRSLVLPAHSRVADLAEPAAASAPARAPRAQPAPALALPPHRPAGAGASGTGRLSHKASAVRSSAERPQTPVSHPPSAFPGTPGGSGAQGVPSISTQPAQMPRRVSYAHGAASSLGSAAGASAGAGFSPVMESVDHAVKAGLQPGGIALPPNMSSDDFTRAVAVATVSALRHQQQFSHSPARNVLRASGGAGAEEAAGGHGGHEAPSWSRTTSASVLLICTVLYAGIAELLVDVVDVILEGLGIDEKFLGVTLFALVPNTTEFMNAISFALNGNIALSMEIGSAYALQVCLLQIPAMVAFSAWYAPDKMGEVATTFTLIFPRWDVAVIILSMFLMTYTWIEAKSNYHRGSILILSYLVLTAGFFAPSEGHTDIALFQTARWSLTPRSPHRIPQRPLRSRAMHFRGRVALYVSAMGWAVDWRAVAEGVRVREEAQPSQQQAQHMEE
ncbi:hypothetical protein C8R47DRAFT_1206045 [Mycena vitilis]|nr:hypothetical protein C8R47DRAFT_1206045 [Mycena vitilis]